MDRGAWLATVHGVAKSQKKLKQLRTSFICFIILSTLCISIFLIFLNYLFIWLHWVFVAMHRLSLMVVTEGYSLL